MNFLSAEVVSLLKSAGVGGEIEFTKPPNMEMGDLAFACFNIAKERKMSPVEAAKELELKIKETSENTIIDDAKAVGPYLNFYFNPQKIAKKVFTEIKKADKKFGCCDIGKNKKILVEFAHPNTHKMFHIGHLRNIITGETVSRIFDNAGFKVKRVNYQGDVGMHIAKCLYGISRIQNSTPDAGSPLLAKKFKTPCRRHVRLWRKDLKSIEEKMKFLGQAYAAGSKAFDENEEAKKEIIELNEKIYSGDKAIKKLYHETRKWSLKYFDKIYKRVNTKFDRLYFESETFKRGKEIVLEFLKKGIFKESDGAIIFEGSKYGLHDRVFVNGKGFPTYEAKDLALAELQFKENGPDKIFHVVAKEQSEYFKVMFKALEFTLPKSKDKEKHLVYGWVSLKEGKMSSRSGQVVLGEWLLDEAEKKIFTIIKDREIKNKEAVVKKIALAAVKYSMLKTGVGNDMIFDINESISLTGDSGPYLLYICARVKSILKKSGKNKTEKIIAPNKIELAEKKLLLSLARFPEAAAEAAAEDSCDPSKIAKYLFELAREFNDFYQECPVLKAEKETQAFRLSLIKSVGETMAKGLNLLGIETVEEM
ncbi:MAG: arginine--tRNA ligase [Patescibacteria group bacterium]